jgi:hypothetical protein
MQEAIKEPGHDIREHARKMKKFSAWNPNRSG